jgi:glucokinase
MFLINSVHTMPPTLLPLSPPAPGEPHAVEAARPPHLREANCRALLRLLRKSSPCSKADLVRSSGLSAPTVAAAVAQLAEYGLVEPIGEGKSSGGRPPDLLRFNASHGYVAGADIGGTYLRMMLADLDGTTVATWEARLKTGQKTPGAVVSQMREGLTAMAESADALGRVRHITVGAPGITDVRAGVVKAAPNLQDWNDVPLQSLLESGLGMQATVENDVNLAALGERARGIAHDARDFVFIAMGTGVGAGIYVEGSLHHGATWSAGEIGYLPVAGMPRETMRLNETGQLERVIGGAGIEDAWRAALLRNGLPDGSLQKLRASQIFDLAGDPAGNGHMLALEIVDSTARILADAISILGLLYDPKLVVLGGGVGSHEILRATTEDFLHENELAQPLLRTSSLGKQAQLFGAISLSLAAIEAGLFC